jgi:hypothetical protein
MSVAVVTTFSPKGYEVYGRRFIESFALGWPEDVKLYVFHEGDKPKDASERAAWFSLDDDMDRKRFMERHEDIEDRPGDYRFRVVRYSHKVWAQTSAPRDAQHLVWLDADCETLNHVTADLLGACLPPAGLTAAYLARPYARHTETGFISYNMNACGSDFLDEFRRMYTSGDVVTLPEWHDCMVFDFVRRRFERAGHRFHNLCPDAVGLNVFEQSPLAKFIRHNKGPARKQKEYGDPMLSMEETA